MAILILSFFVVNLHFSVVDSLENPILSDTFGLDIDSIPLVFIATLIFYTSSNYAMWVWSPMGEGVRTVKDTIFRGSPVHTLADNVNVQIFVDTIFRGLNFCGD